MESMIYPTLGGILIGLSSSLLLYTFGRIAGISGILSSLISFRMSDNSSWKYFFIIGLIGGGFIMKFFKPSLFNYSVTENVPLVITAGLIVGFGTRLGSGCTSGHGVCGLPRKSLRSIVATLTFMAFGILTVLIKGVF